MCPITVVIFGTSICRVSKCQSDSTDSVFGIFFFFLANFGVSAVGDFGTWGINKRESTHWPALSHYSGPCHQPSLLGTLE